MSDMLEQAIIDAEALKEAAAKNAETLILEKYSDQIRNAVDSLLEQEEPALGDLGGELEAAIAGDAPAEDPTAPGAAPVESSVMEHIPLSVTAEDDGQIEIPLDKLLEEITNMTETMSFQGGDEVMDPSLAEELTDLEEACPGHSGVEEDEDLYEEIDLVELDLSEEESLEEAVSVDIQPKKGGWLEPSQGVIELAEEELLAMEQDAEVHEERAALRKAVSELTATNETVTTQNNKLVEALDNTTEYITKLKDAVTILEEKLDKANVENAKMLYQNMALVDDSLNERQKQKLAEAVASATTIEEAKVIFETLQNTVGGTSRNAAPNSLSEAVQKTSSVILSSRRENSREQNANPTLNRWKFLAGIDK